MPHRTASFHTTPDERSTLMQLRKVSATAAATLMLFGLAACNRTSPADSSDAAASGAAGEDIVIGLAVANLQADFFNQIEQSVTAEAEAQGVTVQVSDAGGDSATQVNQIQDFITRGVDAIIYIPAGATAAGVPVAAAKAAGIPVVAVDRNAPDEPGDTFIATDSVAAAQELGEYVIEQTGGTGNVAILQGEIGTTPQVDRQTGFEAALAEAPGMTVIAQQTANWNQDEGFSVAQDMIQANPDINVFFGQADAMALGAAQASVNLDPKPLVVGFDGDTAGLEAVAEGRLDATMVQQTQLMGRLAVESAIALANDEDVPAEQLQSATLLTKDDTDLAEQFIAEHP